MSVSATRDLTSDLHGAPVGAGHSDCHGEGRERQPEQLEEMPVLATCGFPCWCRAVTKQACLAFALQLDSLPQGTDPSPKPLIIGPEEDYDPGYFNNEVPVPWVLLSSWLCIAVRTAGVGCGEAATVEEPGETNGRPQPSLSLCLPERPHLPGPGEAQVPASPPRGVPALHLLPGRSQPPGKWERRSCWGACWSLPLLHMPQVSSLAQLGVSGQTA